MMKEASEAMDRVLAQREKDLKTWGYNEQEEFFKIFGSKGERLVHINMPIKGKENIVEMAAIDVIKDCIRRFRSIKKTLTQESYLNKIYDPDNPNASTNYSFPIEYKGPKVFCAFVNPEQQEDYKINIGINFTGRKDSSGTRTCEKVMGIGSRVATLCHEISHFEKKYSNNNLGGMGTGDYDENGQKPLPTAPDNLNYLQHLSIADDFVLRGDEKAFDHAYNIERYFQIVV